MVRVLSVTWLVALAISIESFAATAADKRQHFALKDKASRLAYSVTMITQTPDETETRDIFLIEDLVTGDRLVITDRRDYFHQTREVEVVDSALKEKAIAIVQFPYKSETRTETIEEMRAAAKAGAASPEPLPIRIDINGVSVTTHEREWLSDKLRERRSTARRAASAMFMERLERLRPIVGSTGQMANVCRFLLAFVLNHEACRDSVKFEPAPPDCEFDASFRYACSDEQKRNVARAQRSGKVPPHY